MKNDLIYNGLNSFAYTDNNFWLEEAKTVFSDNWVFVGCKHKLINIGDILPIKVAGQPIILVKNSKEEINAFHNICSHRCIKLVDQPKNVKKIISCPYHAWAYDLDGNLLAAPHFGGINNHKPNNFTTSNHGLKSIRIKVWYDWIFINLNNNAPNFETYAAPLINQLRNINLKNINPVATLEFGEIKSNWKFLIENFIEPYHVQFVHKNTTSQPLSEHYTIVDGMCYGSGVDLEEEDASSENLAVTSKYLSLFPNFIIGTYFPGQLGVYLNEPVDVDRTIQTRIIYTTEGNNLTESQIEKQKNLWWKVHKEDHEICERLQQGRSSLASLDGGLLSPHWEDSVRAFQQIVIKSINK
ncbi:MAG: aromatic ring-hydroxylating dioxygenase subunit alpha [Pelagibacteraceae bacterium]|nr:aromatic ring-hydroxylating dioxygenase subunit alpha [Pelagibacteraceae bacterium]